LTLSDVRLLARPLLLELRSLCPSCQQRSRAVLPRASRFDVERCYPRPPRRRGHPRRPGSRRAPAHRGRRARRRVTTMRGMFTGFPRFGSAPTGRSGSSADAPRWRTRDA
jgi:hypothetical protein